jgi:hypothetical protein
MTAAMRRVVLIAACVVCAAPALAAPPAFAADPGLWVLTSTKTIPAWYRQGLASDPSQNVFFSGSFAGIYRTRNLVEKARNTSPIPPDVAKSEQYNHIGDIAWDAGEGGRLLLPLEGYAPFGDDHNPGKTGGVGVMDPVTLKWRYYVKLDPSEIDKAMWFATDAARGLLWTIRDADLLAYNLSDINPSNAAPSGPVIHAVRRLVGVVPNGAGGAVVLGGRIYLSTQATGVNQIISIDPNTGSSQLEVELPGNLEVEGMEAGPYLGGLLHWELVPDGGLSNTQLFNLVPTGAPLRVALSAPRVRADRKTALTATVTVATAGARVPLPGVEVRLGGKSVKTGDDGRAKLNVNLTRGSYKTQAFYKGLRTGTKRIRAI